jgi:tetratricopeptide (TPR) repeat protein
MRMVRVLLLAGTASVWSSAGLAADALKQGPAPAWVVHHDIPAIKATDAPVQLLLEDEQVAFERGKVTTYSEGALKIQNSQGLDAGNLALVWQPATDTVTVNKLQIVRGGKVIDVLAGGQTFTILRRETNLDAATLDGTLTATLQPEGLQEGDTVVLATTTEHSDPVLKGHVEAMFGTWGGIPIGLANAALQWPSDLHVTVRQTANLPAPKRSSAKGMTELDLTATDVQPLVAPKGAPGRFTIGRLAEASDFGSWADLADLMSPLYRAAAVIPAAGPLHDEVEKIRAASPDPRVRATQALALVQDRVRYVALLMGQGGYVPASAEQTWSRRFGDCKAKTALLLAILQSLGIQAEPVLVQTKLGDMIADRLPMVALFNHVLVRAHIAGQDYWLDGTRNGDTDLAAIQIPDFGWGLPLVQHAQLVHMVPKPLDLPSEEQRVAIDVSAGVYTVAPITIQEIYRGDVAVALNTLYSAATAEQREQALHAKAVTYFDGFTTSSSTVNFDKAKRELDLTIKGTAKLNWKDGWFTVPTSSIGFDPDFDRPTGPLHDAPMAVSYPTYEKDQATIRLPAGFAAGQKPPAAVNQTLAGVNYTRSETLNGDLLTVDSAERSIAPEVPYKDALAAEAQLRSLNNEDVYVRVPGTYHATDADLDALRITKPASAADYFLRANVLAQHNRTDEALADLAAGLALDPKNSWALEKRADINLAKQHYGEVEKDLQTASSTNPDNAEVIAYRGRLALEKGDVAGAAAAFDEALQRDPKNSMARFGRARVLLEKGQLQDSLHEIGTILESDPRNADSLALRAQILDGREDLAGSDRDIAAALAIAPDNAWVLATKAGILVDRKDYAGAKVFVAKSLARDPNQPTARAIQAELLKRDGGSQQLAAFDTAVTAAPHDPLPLINRAAAHLDAKDLAAADKDLSAALALDPGNQRALMLRSDVASETGDYAGALKALNAVLATSISNGPVLAARAELYRQMHKFDLALADTDAAIKTGLLSPELRLLRINILLGKEDIPAVTAEADQLVKENPASDFALVAAGKTYAATGSRAKAMACFDRAIALAPQSFIYMNREQVRPHDDLEGKLADLDAALKLNPNQDEAIGEKARLLSRAGRSAEAITLYDSAIKTALDSSQLQLWRAVALEKAGRHAEAKAAFDAQLAKAKTAGDFDNLCLTKARNDVLLDSALQDCRQVMRMDADYPDIHEVLGLVLLKLGKLQDSLAAYDKAIAAKAGAESYLGRAIVHQRLGDLAAARADAAKARALRADIDDIADNYGLKLDITAPPHIAAAAK